MEKLVDLTFGQAVDLAIQRNAVIARRNWNKSGQAVFVLGDILSDDAIFKDESLSEEVRTIIREITPFRTLHLDNPVFAIYNTKSIQVGWVPSQGDLFGQDWFVLDFMTQ